MAPIARAVSDKTAQNLLGERFKLQVKYDNSYSCITFIASKADDISISEATKDLELSDDSYDFMELSERLEEVSEEIGPRKRELEALEAEFSSSKGTLNEAEIKLDMWQKLAVKQEAGHAVFSPQVTPQKRRLRGSPRRQTTKRTAKDHDYTFGEKSSSQYINLDDSDDSDGSDECDSETEDERGPLSRDRVQSNLDKCKASHVEALQTLQDCESRLLPAREAYLELEDELSTIKPIVKAMCIRARNAQSRSAIREDFARGIRE